MRRFRYVTALAVSAALVVGFGVPANASAQRSTTGARGAGDPYFPRQGNGGYRVSHYRLVIRYTPSGHKLAGTAIIAARATQRLSRFDLDLRRSLHASSVVVNGAAAAHRQPAAAVQELVITPKHVLHKGQHFTVRVKYAGVGKAVSDPDGSPDGWIPTGDGAFVASEPQGSPTWFPVNDTPRDKATYRISMNVPNRLAAIGNGRLESRVRKGTRTTWTWRITRPISSYLVTATVGKFDIRRGHTKRGVPYLIAVDPTQRAKSAAVLRKLPAIVDYFSSRYGRYPFKQTGAIVDNAPFVGYALETATRPVFDRAPDELTVAHELAHEWYGDTVTLRRWRDIWLNEGFAEFSSWLWDEHRGGMTGRQHLREWLAHGSDVNPPPANPGNAASIFSGSVYDRGAATLQALREKLGHRTFFRIMRGWLAAHRYGNATVPQFTAYAERVSHRNLDHFFHVWLYRKGKP